LLGSLATTAASGAQPAPTTAAVAPANGPIRLFDGQSLGDCYTFLQDTRYDDPRRVFRVTQGLLHVTGDGLGSIITRKAYRDYHLVLEYRWGEKTWGDRADAARDSGLLIHSNGPDGGYGGIWMPSIEVQIIEGGAGDFILVTPDDEGGALPMSLTAAVTRDQDGEVVWKEAAQPERFDRANRHRINWRDRDPAWEDVRGFRGARDVESPGTQWTRIDVIAAHDRITTFVNGEKVNEATSVSPMAGQIQLQAELAEIYFRRWELYPSQAGPPPARAPQ
jgi:hypothetical protein